MLSNGFHTKIPSRCATGMPEEEVCPPYLRIEAWKNHLAAAVPKWHLVIMYRDLRFVIIRFMIIVCKFDHVVLIMCC